jgi:hypothetical protein
MRGATPPLPHTFSWRGISLSIGTSLPFPLPLNPIRSHELDFIQVLVIKYEGRFSKFVDTPNYSESELCGDAVTVSFSKYLPWQAMHFLQRSAHFSKTCCGLLIASKFLASELPFHGWKSPEIA